MIARSASLAADKSIVIQDMGSDVHSRRMPL
jgi:hypothetical protein